VNFYVEKVPYPLGLWDFFCLKLHPKILILGCGAVLNFIFLELDKEQKIP